MKTWNWLTPNCFRTSVKRGRWSLSRTRVLKEHAEVLESRVLLASDITATISKGTLLITGGGDADRVTLEPGVQAGTVRISVDGGTINGQAGPLDLPGLTSGLNINLGNGNNTLAIQGFTSGKAIAGNVLLTTGSGADTVSFTNTQIGGTTKIFLGAGNDTLSIDDSRFAKTFTADLGEGSDGLLIERRSGFAGGTDFASKVVAKLGAGIDVFRAGVNGDNTRRVNVAKKSAIDGGTEADALSIATNSNIITKPKNVETQPPAVLPVITPVLTNDSALGGGTNSDGLTNDPGVSGTISGFVSGSTLIVGLDSMPLASYLNVSTSLQPGGNFVLTKAQLLSLFPGQLGDGNHTLSFRVTDTFGESSDLASVSFTLDTVAPVVSTLDLNAAFDSGTIGDDATNSTTATLFGTATPFSTVTLNPGGASVNADGSGNFQFVNVALALGSNVFTVQASDVAGNTSTALTLTVLRVPTIPAPSVTSSLSNDTAPGGTTNSDSLTFDPAIAGTVTGQGPNLVLAGGLDGSTPAQFANLSSFLQPDGSFSLSKANLLTLFPGQLTEGAHTLKLQLTDNFGHVSGLFSLSFTLDTSAPSVTSFVLSPAFDSGEIGDQITNSTSVTLLGTGSPLATVTLNPGSVTVSADGSGNFQFTNVALAMGANAFTIVSTDAAGNSSGVVTLNLTRIPPVPPPTVAASLSNDTAPGNTTNTDGITSDAGIAGTITSPNETLQLFAGLDGDAIAQFVNLSAFVQVGGAFAVSKTALAAAFPGRLTDGTHTLQFRAIDGLSQASSLFSLTFTLDTTAPTITSFGLDQPSNSGTIDDLVTSVGTVTLVGNTAVGSNLTMVPGNLTATANGSGQFQFGSIPLSLGDNVFGVTAVDAAGNVGATTSITVTRVAAVVQASLVETWNQIALEALRIDDDTPPQGSRGLAMVHVAVMDAVAAILNEPRFMVSLIPTAGASPEAAVIGAAYRVLSYLYPAQQASLDAQRTLTLATLPNDAARTAGEAFGQQVGQAIIDIRTSDGWNDFQTYNEVESPGVWQPTAPFYAEALLPQWADLTPFGMTDPTQFLPDGPPDLNSPEYAAAYNELIQVGGLTGSSRTATQTAIARFWADGGGTYTPPGHWNQIAATVASTRGLTLLEDARLFAALNVGLADAAITAWNAKYEFDFWRPIDAIQQGNSDGNANTTGDPTWQPFIISPPFPEYVSGHSTFSGTAAQILTNLLGDNVSFTAQSIGYRDGAGNPIQRNFNSFWAAAQEAGQSRIYGGIHFQFSNQDGLNAGQQIGDYITQLFTVTTDITPPRVTIQQPEDLAVIPGNVTVQGRTFDNLSGVDLLEVAVDNGPYVSVAFDANGNFSFPTTFAVNGSADGIHTLHFRATDNEGLQSAVFPLTLTLDTTAPTVTLTSPLQGAALAAGDLLKGSASGTGSTIVLLCYQFDGGQPVPITFSQATGQFSQELELANLSTGQHTLTIMAEDGAGRQTVVNRTVHLDQLVPFELTTFTPQDNLADVGTTFRPQIFFSRAVDPASLNSNNFFATDSGGQKIPATIVPSNDGRFAWLFFNDPLPGAANITVHVVGTTILAASDASPLDADLDGNAGGTETYSFSTVSLTPLLGTSLIGKLLDPGPDLIPMSFDDIGAGPDGSLHTADDVYKLPIAHVHVFILGLEDQGVFTDAQGNFHFDAVPAGTIKLVMDGRTATNVPAGFYFPEMVMDLQIVAGTTNTAMGTMGTTEQRVANRTRPEVYLPRIREAILQDVSETDPTLIGVLPEAAANLTPQQRQSLTLQIEPQSVLGPDGQPLVGAQVGLSTVPPELVRDMLPPGVLQHTFDITIQAPGASTFAEPLTLTFPNVFNAAPGTKLNFLSFDHTTGKLVIEGTATVSADGLTVVTDPGMGITKPGWHGLTPPGNRGRNDKPRWWPRPRPNPTFPNPTWPPVPSFPPGPTNPPVPPGPTPPSSPNPPTTPRPQPQPPGGDLPGPSDGFDIVIRFTDNSLSPEIQAVFETAAQRWEQIIVGDIANVKTDIGMVDDIVIDAFAVSIDGVSGILGSAAPTALRSGTLLPARGRMRFDTADLNNMLANGKLLSCILHEMGHVLGVGTIWNQKGLLTGAGTTNPQFTGANAVAAYTALAGTSQTSVPVEGSIGPGSNDAHFRESVFQTELMTPLIAGNINPFSRLTAASMADLGYTVNIAAADAYTLPAGVGGSSFFDEFGFFSETDPTYLRADVDLIIPDVIGVVGFRGDFGTASSPVAESFTRVTEATVYNPGLGYGWQSADMATSIDHGTSSLTNVLIQDANLTSQGTFLVNLPAGVYDVAVTVGDPATSHQTQEVTLEGILQGSVTTLAGQFSREIYRVLVIDGQLTVDLSSTSQVALNSIEVNLVAEVDASLYTAGDEGEGPTGRFYFAIENQANGFLMRSHATLTEPGPLCPEGVFLASNTTYKQYVYNAETGEIGISTFTTPDSGTDFDMPLIVLGLTYGPDTDGDGLEDLGEFIVGTGIGNVDTDGDGISDFSEIEQGLNPLDGFIVEAGVVAATALQGEAQDIDLQALDQANPRLTGYIATGTYGLAIVDLAKPQNPVVRSQIDLPGDATDVAVDPALQIAAVATGSGGLLVVDVSSPASPQILRTVATQGGRVEVKDGIAYLAGGSTVFAIDLLSGDIVDDISFAGNVVDLRQVGTSLFVVDESGLLSALSISDGTLVLEDTQTLPHWGGKLFVGGGVAYVGADEGFLGGYVTVNVANTSNLTLISDRDDGSIAGAGIAANGSGIVVLVGNPGGAFGVNVADIANSSNPANTGVILTRIDLPSTPYGVAIGSGIAFIANGTSGLQVVNYLSFDTQGLAPTITWNANELDRDLGTAGIQVQEGTTLRVNATFADDVQVRGVELLLDGVVVVRDVSFPFDLSAIAPQLTATQTTATLQVRATDTGGNVASSPLVTLQLKPDIFAPTLVSTSPTEGAARRQIPYLSFKFDEPIDTTVLNLSDLQLLNLGANGVLGGGDDSPVALTSFVTRNDDKVLIVRFDGELAPANYQFTVTPGAITDRVENAFSGTLTTHFTKRPLTVPIALNTVITDEFTDPNDYQRYVFQGVPGQRIGFDGLDFDTTEVTVRLTAPSGAVVLQSYANAANDLGPITLVEQGTYVLEVTAFNGATPEFSFRVIDSQGSQDLTLGTIVNGQTPTGQEFQVYRFQGTADQHVYFQGLTDANDVGYASGGWALYGPANDVVFNSYGYLAYYEHEVHLPQDGEYLLVVYGTDDVPHNFSFRTYLPTTSTTALTLGQVVSSTIAVPGEVDRYTFTGTAGQALYLDGLTADSNDYIVKLVGPHFTEFIEYYEVDLGPIFLTESGTYRLEIDGDGAAIPNYSFRLLDLATAATTLTLDTTVSGPLNPGQSSKFYKFNGSAGQRIYFDGLTDTGTLPEGYYSGGWRLLGPNFESVFDSSYYYLTYSDHDVTLPAAGTYYLQIYGNAVDPVTYDFRTVTPQTTISALTLNATVNGSISESGERDRYTFTGTAGQALYLDGLTIDSNEYNVKLIGPYSTEFIEYSNVDHGPIFLTEAGTYTLEIDGQEAATPNYSFRLLDLATAATTLALDTTVSGPLDPGQSSQFYKFNGSAGQRIYFDGLTDTGTLPEGYYSGGWRLLGPNLESVFDSSYYYLTYTDFDVTLPTAGTYYVQIYGNAVDPMTYDFRTVTPQTTTSALTVGTIVTGSISESGELDRYTFTGTAGQRLILDGLSGDINEFDVRLIGPHLTEFIEYSDLDHGPIFLTESGTYTLEIDGTDAATPDYSFRLLNLLTVASNLTIGATVTDTLDPGQSLTVYKFTGVAGQEIEFDGETDTGVVGYSDGNWLLVGPANQIVFHHYGYVTYSDATVTLPQSGDYFLIVAGTAENAVDYQFTTTLLGTTPPTIEPSTPLTLNSTVTSNISVADEIDRYTFSGVVGQRVLVDGLNMDLDRLDWSLVTPSGAVLDQRYYEGQGDDSGVLILPEPGTYTLVIDGDSSETPAYSFRVLNLATAAVAMTLDTTVNGTVNPGSESDVYTFSGVQGQRIYFDGLNDATGDYYIGGWTLFGPGQETVFDHYGHLTNQDAEVVLPQAGTYYLQINGTSATTENYSFRTITSQTTTTPITLNTTVAGQISKGGEIDNFTFTGTIGQKVLIDALTIDLDQLDWRLLTPSGALLAQRYYDGQGDNSGILGLPEAGTYTLVFDGDDVQTPSYSFQVIDVATGSTPLVLDSTVNSSVNPGNETNVYKFSGTQGQRIYFDGLNQSDIDYYSGGWMLVDPALETSFDNYGHLTHYDAEVVLPHTGTYYLVVNGTSSTTQTYSFRTITSTVTTTPLNFNTTTNGQVLKGGEIDRFTFTGGVGQKVMFDGLDFNLDELDWRLIAPSGTLVDQRYYGGQVSDSDILVLSEQGTYTLELDGDDTQTPTYSFRLLNVATSTVPLVLDTTVNGTLVAGSEAVIYQFAGQQGQRIYFDGLNEDEDDYSAGGWKLIGPGLESVFDNYGYLTWYDAEVELPQDGPYYLVVSGTSDVSHTYSFLTVTPSETVQPLTLGSQVNADLQELAEIDGYTFTGAPGQRIYFDSLDMSLISAMFDLVSPSGDNVFSVNSSWSGNYLNAGPFTLSEAGTYTLSVRHEDGDAGPYSFVLRDVNQLPVLPLNEITTGTLPAGSANLALRFSGVAGQFVSIGATDDAAETIYWSLFGADNTYLGYVDSSDITDFILPGTGTFVLIADSEPRGVDSSFSLTTTSPALALNAAIGTGAAVPGVSAITTSEPQLLELFDSARVAWSQLSADPRLADILSGITFRVADLASGILAYVQGSEVVIDLNGGGQGWFIDPTPEDDSEFSQVTIGWDQAAVSSVGRAGVDLKTVMMHEIGHVLGLGHSSEGVMQDSISTGLRRNVSASDLDHLFATLLHDDLL